MEAIINGESFQVEIIRKNNKNVYFRFNEGILVVTCNRFVSEKEILRMIEKNEGPLYRMYKKQTKRDNNEKIFTYLGKPTVKVFDESIKKITIEDGYIYAKNERQFDKWYKEECERVFSIRIRDWLPYFDDIPKFSLRVRTMKTRWGVNNVTKKIVTLNSELLKKNIDLIDYVIVHELCHFYEANHSKRFWNQVEKRYPRYKEARKALRS